MTESWYVSVHVNGREILFISPNELAGEDISDELAKYVELAARNLLSFIGRNYTIEARDNNEPF